MFMQNVEETSNKPLNQYHLYSYPYPIIFFLTLPPSVPIFSSSGYPVSYFLSGRKSHHLICKYYLPGDIQDKPTVPVPFSSPLALSEDLTSGTTYSVRQPTRCCDSPSAVIMLLNPSCTHEFKLLANSPTCIL